MTFVYREKVLFRHCDPAGIVFYPRYFEMINDAVETFFGDALGYASEHMHPETSMPTAEITTRFTAPSRHGDRLDISVAITRIGRSSLGLAVNAHCGSETRFEAALTVVHVDRNIRPLPWPEDLKPKMNRHLRTENP